VGDFYPRIKSHIAPNTNARKHKNDKPNKQPFVKPPMHANRR